MPRTRTPPANLRLAAVQRPAPPASVLAFTGDDLFEPAPDVAAWLRSAFLAPSSPFYNADHEHLETARLGVLWTNVPLVRQLRSVVATAEIPLVMGHAWKRGRHAQQLREWFGELPDFLITLAATPLAEASDRLFCAIIEHELYHCSHDPTRFRSDGSPVWAIRGHDVEEFTGVVRRYGAVGAGVTEMVRAANRAPEYSDDAIGFACGTCSAKVA